MQICDSMRSLANEEGFRVRSASASVPNSITTNSNRIYDNLSSVIYSFVCPHSLESEAVLYQ